jgi:DNA-binding NarL/FixJ family response regulator
VFIDDHHGIREEVLQLLSSSPNIEATGFESAEEAILSFQAALPDIILMDINLPGADGITMTRKIKEHFPAVHVMMCTIYEDDEKIFKALAAGASGYILKSSAGTELVDAINGILNGGAPMSPAIARRVVNSFRQTTEKKQVSTVSLTPRENEILDLLAQGFRNKDIADKLFVSVNTIRTHIYNIYEKLHVQNRIEALNITGRNGRQ